MARIWGWEKVEVEVLFSKNVWVYTDFLEFLVSWIKIQGQVLFELTLFYLENLGFKKSNLTKIYFPKKLYMALMMH